MRLFPETFSVNRLLFLSILAALLSCSTGSVLVDQRGAFYDPRSSVKEQFVRPTAAELAMAKSRLTDSDRLRIARMLQLPDPGLSLYRDPGVRSLVIDYFCNLTNSDDVALSILYHADHNNVPLLLAFSLAWVESRYVSQAVNVNASSVDRGIFQLNSLSFPNLSVGDFFHPDTNIEYGIRHLKYCLELSSNEAGAIAIYNAGLTTVLNRDIPASTRSYVSRILQFQRFLAEDFRAYIERGIEKS